jgi:two-component system sensor histidine kinase DesK
LSIQYAAIIGIYFTVPFAYCAILVTLWCSLLLHVVPIRWALITSPLWSSPLFFIFSFYWQKDHMFFSALLFMMFSIFALIMVDTAARERKASEQANRLNRELLATQSLLGQATRQAERIRIARNIHDLLGHHLTALSINLQVASRITDGEAKNKVDQCHSLAQLLLSDVREAVCEIRDKSVIELKSALLELVNNIPRLQVNLNYDNKILISDVELAETIVRCVQESITNSLKHGKATQFDIELKEQQQKILLSMFDNGIPQPGFKAGNGLNGIQERVRQLGGTVRFETEDKGFRTSIEIPQPA